jgi:hypothetical protein
MTITPGQLAAEAKRLRAEAKRVLSAAQREAQALLMRAQKLDELAMLGVGLTNLHGNATIIDTMDTNAALVPVRMRPGPKYATRHPLLAYVKQRKISVAKLAVELGVRETTLRSWYSVHQAVRRKIPRSMADRLSRPPYGIPPSAWANGIDDDE